MLLARHLPDALVLRPAAQPVHHDKISPAGAANRGRSSIYDAEDQFDEGLTLTWCVNFACCS